jgi:hypothetical protein
MGSHIGLELPFRSATGRVKITQGFSNGDHGAGPSTSWDKYFYYAVDFAVVAGTPVVGQGSGTVIASRMTASTGSFGPPDGLGNYITVEYDDGVGNHFYATYMHLNPSSVPKYVLLGQVFAYSGNTGASTGPHLHVTYGATKISLDSASDQHAGLPQTTSHVTMADGSLAHNPHGAPVFFTSATSDRGFLLATHLYQSDNGAPNSEFAATVRAFDQNAGKGQWSEMNGWFFASDPNPADRISYWLLYDSNASQTSGHFWAPSGWISAGGTWRSWSGGEVPANTIVLVTTASMAQSQFVGGTKGGSQDALYVQAWDGHQYSGWKEFVVTTLDHQISGTAAKAVGTASGSGIQDDIGNHTSLDGILASNSPHLPQVQIPIDPGDRGLGSLNLPSVFESVPSAALHMEHLRLGELPLAPAHFDVPV